MGSGTTTLEARDLFKQLGGRTVVDRVTLSVRAGEVVGLLGPNGAGKTTIFKMLMGLVRPDAGQVLLGGRDITRLAPHLRARMGLGYLSQQPSVFQGLTVAQNLRVALELTGRPAEESTGLLSAFSLAEVAQRRAGVLSGGERRRLELARIAAVGPGMALLDEPLKGLDGESVRQVTGLIEGLADGGRGVLVTDHAIETMRAICHRVCLLEDGRLTAEGTPEQLLVGDSRAPRAEATEPIQPGMLEHAPDWRREWHSN